MTRSEAVKVVQARLGGRYDTRTQTMIETELLTQQEYLETRVFLPWFLFQEAQVNSVIGESDIPVPEDFLREYAEDINVPAFWYQNAAGKWLPVPKKMVMDVYFLEGETGPPRAYSLFGGVIRLWPVPDAVYPCRLYYFRKDNKLTSDFENDWLKHASSLLCARAGEAVAVNLRDKDAVAFFQGKVQEAEMELLRVHLARQDANLYVENGA